MDRQPLLPVVAVSAPVTTASKNKSKACPHAQSTPIGDAIDGTHPRRPRLGWAVTLVLSATVLWLLYLSTTPRRHHTTGPTLQTEQAPRHSSPTSFRVLDRDNDAGHFDRLFQSIMTRMHRATHLSTGYCQSNVPTRSTYTPPASSHPLMLRKVLVFARHGDRSPQNVLRDDVTSNITWACDSAEYTYIHDATTTTVASSRGRRRRRRGQPLVAKRVNHINAKAPWHPRMWRGSCAQSELTAKGRQMHLDFGKALREVYAERLGLVDHHGVLDLTKVRVRASDVARTLRSAQAVVEGMYPGATTQRVREWSAAAFDDQQVERPRKVNIYTLPTEIDPLHSNKLDQQCPRLARIGAQIKDHPLWNTFLRESLHTRALVSAIAPLKSLHAPSSLSTAQDQEAGKKGVPSVTENLMCRTCWAKPMPCMSAGLARQRVVSHAMLEQGLDRHVAERVAATALASLAVVTQHKDNLDEPHICLDPTTIESLAQFKAFDFYIRNNWFPNRVAPDQIKLEMGPLLREILDVLTVTSAAADDPSFHLFLTHDGTLSGLLGALRVAPEHHSWPAYRSNVVVEVWEPRSPNSGQAIVRVLRDGEPIRLDPELHPPCELGNGSCLLSTFMEDLAQRSAEDWEQACLVE